MHEVIVTPFLGNYVVLRPGAENGIKISRARYEEIASADGNGPPWFADAVHAAWNVDISERPLRESTLVRPETSYGYGRASYELNLGCNYDCEHCYLGLKKFEGLEWAERERLLGVLRDAGVVWLQLTGGEPMIDRLFAEVYGRAYELGMMLTLLSNGSRLFNPRVLDLLTSHRPHRITLSVYGATEESYDGLTRRKGAYRLFMKGLYAGHEAGLPLALSMIVTKTNAHEVDRMRDLAERLDIPMDEYVNMVPTIYGGAETLPSQSREHLRKRK